MVSRNGYTEKLFSNLSPAPQELLEYCSQLYNSHRYCSANGETDPYDPRYYNGGVHFSRSPVWFADHLKRDGARLLALYGGLNQPIGFTLFFLNPASFPAFAGSAAPFNNLAGLNDRVGYNYIILIDPQFRSAGLALDLIRSIVQTANEAGCFALLQEYCRNPVPNLASSALNERKLVAEFGAVHIPLTSHLMLKTSAGETKIEYAMCLLPTSNRVRLTPSVSGLEIVVDGENYGATPWAALAAQD